jgi:hypothetical protein
VREFTRRAVHARLEVEIPKPAFAALREQRARSILREIGDQRAGFDICNHRADRHAKLDVIG